MRRHRESMLLAPLLWLLITPFGLEAQSQEFTWTSFESFEIAEVPASSVQLLTIDPLGNRWGPSQLNEVKDLGLQEEDSGLGYGPYLAIAAAGGLAAGTGQQQRHDHAGRTERSQGQQGYRLDRAQGHH